MKKFVLALMLLSAVISCKKSDNDVPVEEAIKGKWELRNSFCGWGVGATNYPAGNGNTITFHDNGTYTSTGFWADSGIYRIRVDTSTQGQLTYFLFLGGNRNRESSLKINNITFKLDENAYIADGCEYNYKKL